MQGYKDTDTWRKNNDFEADDSPTDQVHFNEALARISRKELRDNFAGLAMQCILRDGKDYLCQDVAKLAYAMADAMLAQRSK